MQTDTIHMKSNMWLHPIIGCDRMSSTEMNGQKRSERNRDRMKKNDWILAGTVLIAALFFLVGNCFTERRGKDAEKYLRIKVDGEVFREVNLEEDAEITIGEHNRVKIQDGQVEMIWADCPDQICAAHPKISKNRESIICLPNKVILEIVDRADEGSKGNDAVAG